MTYYFSTDIRAPFGEAVQRVRDALSEEGFGILTEIDVAETLHARTGVDFRPYRILGACNPALALEALRREDKVGTMLPCNVIVQQLPDHRVEVAAVDPVSSMQAIDNPSLHGLAEQVRGKLRGAIDRLGRDA